MKVRVLFAILMCFTFACQNENVLNKEEWTQEINKTIKEYESRAEVVFSKTFDDKDLETTIEVYKSDSKGLQKFKGTSYSEYFIDFSYEIFVQNNEIVLVRNKGLYPILYKRQKKETDPCCQVFERLIYFKNDNQLKVYTKEIRIIDLNEKEKFENELSIVPFDEEEVFNVSDVIENAARQLEWFKKKMK